VKNYQRQNIYCNDDAEIRLAGEQAIERVNFGAGFSRINKNKKRGIRKTDFASFFGQEIV
jgi:hypothetical protein